MTTAVRPWIGELSFPDDDLVRRFCTGDPPLPAILQPWMVRSLCSNEIFAWIDAHGSPLNLLNRNRFHNQIEVLQQTLTESGIDHRIHFAQKANKCPEFVHEAIRNGIGLDAASEAELHQAITAGVAGDDLICTAAIKRTSLIHRCIETDAIIVIDNRDELDEVRRQANQIGKRASVAIRLGSFNESDRRMPSRFGFDANVDRSVVQEVSDLRVLGIHFHIDGGSLAMRANAIAKAVEWIDELRRTGQPTDFLDIGGGIPVSHLTNGDTWKHFWCELDAALLGQRPALAWQNHGFGKMAVQGRVHGNSACYDTYRPIAGMDWLNSFLGQSCLDGTVRSVFSKSQIELRCEPGRFLLDGVGMTAARVEYCKQDRNGHVFVGVDMNHTQCRTTYDDFLVDPIVIPCQERPRIRPASGFFVGAACTETEFLSKRRFVFPHGIRRGDLVLFPNTAAYWMHMLESRTHQLHLAENVFVSDERPPVS